MVGIKLKEFQEKCVEELLEQTVFGEKKEILLQAPTGSGKTIMLLEYIDRFLLENKDYVFVWLTPGSGELEEQSKNKMNQLLKNRTTKTLNEVLTTGFEEQDTAFINWENVTKKGNTALRELEKSNLYDRIEQAQNNGIKFIVIIDEEHRNKTEKAESITNLFNAKHTVRVSATTKRNDEAYNIKISEMEVINSGLITKSLYINQGIENNILLDDEIDILCSDCFEKHERITKHTASPLGILGAFIGAVIGGIIWAFGYNLGYIICLDAILLSLLSFIGYKKLGHYIDQKAKIIIPLIDILVLLFAQYASCAFSVQAAFKRIGTSSVSFIQALVVVPGMMFDSSLIGLLLVYLLYGLILMIITLVIYDKRKNSYYFTYKCINGENS